MTSLFEISRLGKKLKGVLWKRGDVWKRAFFRHWCLLLEERMLKNLCMNKFEILQGGRIFWRQPRCYTNNSIKFVTDDNLMLSSPVHNSVMPAVTGDGFRSFLQGSIWHSVTEKLSLKNWKSFHTAWLFRIHIRWHVILKLEVKMSGHQKQLLCIISWPSSLLQRAATCKSCKII